MKRLISTGIALVLALPCGPAFGQSATNAAAPAGFAPINSPCVVQANATCASVSVTAPMPVDGVVRATSVDRGAVVGTTAVTLMAANAARRGYAIQVQSASASCYINGLAMATAGYNSLQIGSNAYYQTPPTHVGTGAISIICTAVATPVFAREW